MGKKAKAPRPPPPDPEPAGAPPDPPASVDPTLLSAVAMVDLEGVTQLLGLGAAAAGADPLGNTLLHTAVMTAHDHLFAQDCLAIVKVLADTGLDPCEPNIAGLSPLVLCAKLTYPAAQEAFSYLADKLGLGEEARAALRTADFTGDASVRQMLQGLSNHPKGGAALTTPGAPARCRVCFLPAPLRC
eukprot:EG_transcript_33127